MKHLYACLLALLLASAARAQTYYQPLFWIRHTYQYTEAGTPGDTTHTVRMAWPHIHFPDSVARLSGRAVAVTRSTPGSCYTTHVVRPDGLFGATVSIKTLVRKEYTLRAGNGRTFVLKPHAALNQPWAATAAGLTAQVTARGPATTFGQPDTVATIALSDGETIRLSRRFGYLEGPALGAYLNGQRRRHLTLTAITGPSLNVGQPVVGPRAMFDYQPGDVFLRYSKLESSSGPVCSESWTRDSVLTRTANAAGDTLRYTIWHRTLTRNYGAPGNPYCSGSGGTTLSPGSVVSSIVAVGSEAQIAELTETAPGSSPNSWRMLTFTGRRTANYFGRKVQSVTARQACQPILGDSTVLSYILDNGGYSTYAAGLGMVANINLGSMLNQTTTLLGYRKVNLPTGSGTETWGSLRTFANILKAADYRPASTTAAFPNPFERTLTVRFETQRAQPVTLELRNALGQLVYQQTQAVAAGTPQLTLQLPVLTAGLYTLRLTVDGRSQVIKVTKE
jgi:Secretion system C-terminal sorting domain